MSAIRQALTLLSLAGPRHFLKVGTGLLRMHWRYFVFGRGRGLAGMLPLATPLKIHVDPASGCNFRCFFCPQSDPAALRDAGVEFRSMSLDLFRKLIDDLSDFPERIDELVLGNYGEPLLNKHLPEMVRYAKASQKIREVSVITNASLLSGERSKQISESGLDKIRISIEAMSNEKYHDVTDTTYKFDDIVKNVRNFYELVRAGSRKTFIYVKIIDINLSLEEKRSFFDTFSSISDAVAIENLMPVTKAATKVVGEQALGMTGVSFSKGRNVCPSPFYSLSIHSDGNVGVCCADWHHKTVVGSVAVSDLRDIWEGDGLRKFRHDQIKKSWRGVEACAGCEMVKNYPIYEDIDGKVNIEEYK